MTRQPYVPGGYRLFRLVPPSRNEASIRAVQASIQNLLGGEPISLEICVEGDGATNYYVRLPRTVRPETVLYHLRTAYPQLEWEEVKPIPGEDPAWPRGEEIAQAEMIQRYDRGLPLLVPGETPEDKAFDPLQGILHLGDALDPGERVLCQMVAREGSERRMRRYRRIVQSSKDPRRREAQETNDMLFRFFWVVVGAVLLFGLLMGFLRRNYPVSAVLIGFGLALSYGMVKLRQFVSEESDLPADLVAEKIRYPCYDCQIRLTAYTLKQDPGVILNSAAGVFRQFGLGSGNRLVAQPAWFDPRLVTLQCKKPSWLSSREFCTVWHLPEKTAEVSGLTRTRAPALLPSGNDSCTGPDGFCVGNTDHPRKERPVYLPVQVLDEHVGVYGASGMGKSNMLRLLGRWVMESGRQLIAIDPHGTLADYLAGAVPENARKSTVYLVAGDASHPFGINMIEADPEGAADRAEMAVYLNQQAIERSVDAVLSTMERARVEAWGLRMRTIAGNGVRLMSEVGRATGFHYSILDLETLVTDPNLLRYLLSVYRKIGQDPAVIAFWNYAWMKAGEYQRREWALPVINRMNLFKGGVMGNIVGSRQTTVDFDKILDEGANLIINADTGSQENTQVLMGVILDLLNLAIRRRRTSDNASIYIILDEFQMVSIGNMEGLINELRKWGVRFILGTQGLGSLTDPSVAAVILNNIQQIFAFSCGPKERETVVDLLDGAVDEKAVSWLDSFHCYTRLRLDGKVQPVFSFSSAQAPAADEGSRQELLLASRAACCREAKQVIEERKAISQYTGFGLEPGQPSERPEAGQERPPGTSKLSPIRAENTESPPAKLSRRQRAAFRREKREEESPPMENEDEEEEQDLDDLMDRYYRNRESQDYGPEQEPDSE